MNIHNNICWKLKYKKYITILIYGVTLKLVLLNNRPGVAGAVLQTPLSLTDPV